MTDEFAIKILEQYREKPTLINEIETVEEAVWLDEALAMAIKALEQEPKIGHWIRELIRNKKGGCIGAKMICSKCGNDNKHDEYMNYCPNCGASMIELQESED